MRASQPIAKVAVIIVTYNSEKHIDKCIACVREQTFAPSQIIIVDSGSKNREYLNCYREAPDVDLVFGDIDIGFCRANNLALGHLERDIDYLFFLNPDAFITETYLETAVSFMEEGEHSRCGALTGTTLGYDIEKDAPTGLYDTTGVFRTRFGRWYDRGQGLSYDDEMFSCKESIPAICGAVFFCRRLACDAVMLCEHELFDNSFYMYKEDIDLSLRLRRAGWHLYFVKELKAYHCRGWNPVRKKMAKKMRLHSALNELTIHWRSRSILPIAYSTMKYFAVRCFNL